MRWSGILAPLKHSHPSCASSSNLTFRSKAAFSSIPSRAVPQKNPSSGQTAGSPSPFPEQARSSSQTFVVSKVGKVSSSEVTAITEAGKASSCQAKASVIRSSSKTITISENRDSFPTSGAVRDLSSPTSLRPPRRNIFTTDDKDRSFASDAVKREPGRSQAHSQKNIKPLEASHVKVSASSIPYPAQVYSPGRQCSEANPSPSNHTEGYGDRYSFAQVNAARNSISASNPKKTAESLLSNGKVGGKINIRADENASARSTKAALFQTEGKAKTRAPSFQSLLDAKGATDESGCGNTVKVQLGEKSVGVASKPGTLNKRPGGCIPLTDENIAVGGVVLSEDVTSFSSSDSSECRLPNGPLVLPEASTALEGKDESGQVVGDESKKPFVISFPVTVFAEWWFYCFTRGAKPYPNIHPFNKIHTWLAAYQRAHLDVTGIYTDGQSASILMKQLHDLLYASTNGKFRWGDKTHVYLPSPPAYLEEKLSPSPNVDRSFSFQDRVVQEVLYLVLEPVFEARFSARSHAFRPDRDAHTALRAVQRSFLGCSWFIRGDLSILNATHVVESVLRVVRDTRVAFLLKSGLLEGMLESTYACMSAKQGSFSRLMHLMCNVFLDQLDWWMDEQIFSFSKREQPLVRSSSNLLFKPSRATVERRHRLEYIRYGTEFLVGYNGTEEEADLLQNNIQSFVKQKIGKDVGISLTTSHISAGVEFLDHVISQKIVHPIVSCRRASNGRVFEKRALRIRLRVKGSRECCQMYFKEVGTPTSLQQIKEMLLVLNIWYQYAENKEKVIEYCKLRLCFLYAKGVGKRHKEGSSDTDFAEQFKEAVQRVNDQMKGGDLDKVKSACKDFIRIPEHEKILRDHAWLQNKALVTQVTASFKSTSKVSPQQHMSQVLWQFLRASNGDEGWEPDFQMQAPSWGHEHMVEQKQEELAESAG